jgi:hypothetical protein
VADSLRVDPAALRAAASHAEAASSSAAPGAAQVQPCAPDCVSVGASTRFSEQVDLARRYTATANDTARQLGVLLAASSRAYETQEATSAALLGEAAMDAPAGVAMPVAMPGAAALAGGEGLAAPAGEVPTAPRDIARLIEPGRGGPGPRAWENVEAGLRSDVGLLESAADQLGAAIRKTEETWASESADVAVARMRALQVWYHDHATYMRGLADSARAHVENFRKATTDIPTYKAVVDGERELRVAQEANQRSRGALRPAVVHAQVKLGQLYEASTTGYTSYTIAESVPEPRVPTPPPGRLVDSPSVISAVGPGDAPIGNRTPAPAQSSAPLAPVDQGAGVGETQTSSGPTWPPGAVDPVSPADALVDALPDTAAAAPEVVPAIIGGLVGGVGGVLGGLAGTGQKAMQGMQQVAAPMASELGQHPGGGGSPDQGGEQAAAPAESSPSGDDLKPPDDGGGATGETAPASAAAPLAAPTGAASAPAIAAPASAPLAAGTLPEASAPATGAMGPMMAPPMGAPRSGGSGDGQGERLYQERQLKVVAPPNSEPVKNRREGRERSREKDRKTP